MDAMRRRPPPARPAAAAAARGGAARGGTSSSGAGERASSSAAACSATAAGANQPSSSFKHPTTANVAESCLLFKTLPWCLHPVARTPPAATLVVLLGCATAAADRCHHRCSMRAAEEDQRHRFDKQEARCCRRHAPPYARPPPHCGLLCLMSCLKSLYALSKSNFSCVAWSSSSFAYAGSVPSFRCHSFTFVCSGGRGGAGRLSRGAALLETRR